MFLKELDLKKAIQVDSSITLRKLIKFLDDEEADYAVIYNNENLLGIIKKNSVFSFLVNENALDDDIHEFVEKDYRCFMSDMKIQDAVKEVRGNLNIKTIVFESVKSQDQILGIIDYDIIIRWFCEKMKNEIKIMVEEGKQSGYVYKTDDEIGDNDIDILTILNDLEKVRVLNKELNLCFENSPNSFDICDSEGTTLRVNKEFENLTGVAKMDVLGRNIRALEAENLYRPSVGVLVLKEKRKISVIQRMKNKKEAVVTGVPVYDENGKLFRVLTNAIGLDELSVLNDYRQKQKKNNLSEVNNMEGKIICESKRMKDIFAMVDDVKDVNSTILITGESGVGKGVVARYIHSSSKRKKERMIEINCGAIPESLLESELLGYEEGAFTGAKKSGKPGLIEVANKGTVFLDEIGEMPMNMQVKLLQVIQEKKIVRVGGVKPIDIDVRIIAATNKDLRKMVDLKEFRLDLYYRINVIPIYIPPLRERKEDIVCAVKYFLNKYNKQYNKSVAIGQAALREIEEHEWKGNMRELENYVERIVVTNASGILGDEHLVVDVFSDGNEGVNYGGIEDINYDSIIEESSSMNEIRKEMERQVFNKIYMKYKSSYRVAEVLKISQTTAYRKLKRYVVDFTDKS